MDKKIANYGNIEIYFDDGTLAGEYIENIELFDPHQMLSVDTMKEIIKIIENNG